MKSFLHTVRHVFSTIIRGVYAITMSPRGRRSQRRRYDWHDFQPWWWGFAVMWGGEWVDGEGVGLAVNTWHGTQPGRLMVLTASAQWLGIRGCNWVEPKYGHSRQLLIAGANHTLPSLPRFQLFATSGKDTRILLCTGEAALRFLLLITRLMFKEKIKHQLFQTPLTKESLIINTPENDLQE